MITLKAQRLKQNGLDLREENLYVVCPSFHFNKVRPKSPEFSRKTHARALRGSVKRHKEGNNGDRHSRNTSRHIVLNSS